MGSYIRLALSSMVQQKDAARRGKVTGDRGNASAEIAILSLFISVLALGCSREEQVNKTEGSPLSAGSGVLKAQAPDRLPAGQLLEGEEVAFGLRIPKGMKLTKTRKLARASGNVNFDDLSDYVKDRLVARHAEMFGGRLVFPQAKVRGNLEGLYEVTLINGGREQVLLIQDIERPPATVGLSQAERWKRAGLKANGELVDPKGMQ